jgi:hypothetical protein
VAVAVVAVALLLVFAGLGDNPAKQIRLAAEWKTGTQQIMFSEMDTLQVRLDIENRTEEPVFIQPTTDELFESKEDTDRDRSSRSSSSDRKRSFMDRLAEQSMKEAMEEMEEAMPKNVFRLQVAVGGEKQWAPLSPHNWELHREGNRDEGPEISFDMFMGPGWTIPPRESLHLAIRVAARPKGGGYGPTFGTVKAGETPDAIRVRAVRAPEGARVPELVVPVPEDIRKAWSKES